MPSTFTTSGVELIADGEQSGLWGQTTNLNLQIIDRLTSQAGTITLSGTTHTLTVSDGVLSDGQYNVLVFAGTPSGTNTVTISPNTAQRTFFVRNTTAQSVVLSQGSGANATVLAGTARIVYTNGGGTGAAVFDITNTLAANTAATLQTARTIGGVSFNGSANINLPGVNQVGNQNTTGSAASLTTARTIGGVSFNGTANIDLPGVNQAGNQNTTGSAASLTTARTFTIGSTGKTFNGTANVAWTLGEIGVNNATLTLATSGIATGSQTFTANQGTNATFTVNVPATNLTYSTAATTGTVNSSTGTNATIPAATTSLAGLMTNADKTKLDGIAAGAQVNVATNLTYSTAATTGTVNSSTGTNATIPAATTSLAGLMTNTDKTKLDGIAAGAQVNVATNLSVTDGTTAGPTINSSTGTNATIPTASGTASGAVTTGAQTFAGTKTFSAAVVLSTAGTTTTQAVRADRTITTGTGITGGGDLTANRTLSIDIATQAEAEAGTVNNKVMTPLRAAQTARLFGNPAGSIIFHAANTPPAGYLKANGAAVSRTTYADLFAAIGTTFGVGDGSTTFVLPDLRGEFPRGWDDGRGVDSGRGFGTAQLDQMQRITGGASTRLNRGVFTNNVADGAITTANQSDATYAVSNDFSPAATSFTFNSANSPDARVSATTSGETRSRNVALLACIKF